MMKDIVLDKLTVNYEKNAKIVYIKDDKERIRFVVSLIEIDRNEKTSEDNGWILKVQEVLFPKDELFELSRQFFKINEEHKAYKTMEKMIRDYQTVVNLPCGKINPKDIFNDTVNYRRIDPDRCENCIFCIFHEDWSKRVQKYEDKRIRYLCSCKKNLRMNEYAHEILGKYASRSQITNIQDMIEVEPDCVCDNHCRTKEQGK